MATTINPSDQTITQYNIQTGGASNLLNNVAPSSTSGVPVISQGSSSQPIFGTAVVAGGGTGQTTLTNHGVLVGAGTSAITQLAAGTSGQVLQSGGASADPAYSTATYPATATSTGTILRADGTNWSATSATYPNTTTSSQLLYSSSTNTVGGLSTANDGLLVTSNSGVPSILAGPGTTGNILQSNAAAAPSFSTATYPSSSGGTGKILYDNGTNFVESTPTFPASSSATSGKIIQSDGTNWVASTPTYPSSSGGSGKIIYDNGTNFVESVPTFPASASATSRKIIVSDGTNWTASTETWATPGSNGNVLTSDGTNWTSAAAPGGGLLSTSGSLTNSQIKNLHGTPVQAIAAPGSGKVIFVISAVAKLNYGGTNAFTAAASQTIQLYYGTAISITGATCNLLQNSTITATSNQIGWCGGNVTGANPGNTTYTTIANTAVNFYNSVATEISGNAANDNTISWFIQYVIVTI